MGATAQSIKYILRLKKNYNIGGPILTLGNQDVYATKEDVIKWIKEIGLPLKVPSDIEYCTSKGLLKINKETANYIHARTFFEFLGIPKSQYYDIDKFEFDKPVILHDLQKPLDEHYHNFFNFILDIGTMEHIFDVKAVMSNIVNAAKIGGYVLQMLPMQNFINHGFYQFSPTLFYDFYTANGFEIVESYVIETKGTRYRFHNYKQEKDYIGLFFNPANRLGTCFFVRKVFKKSNIVSPDQYLYKKLNESPDIVEKDFNKTFLDKAALLLRRIVPVRFHGLFFTLWTFLKRLRLHRNYFDLKH